MHMVEQAKQLSSKSFRFLVLFLLWSWYLILILLIRLVFDLRLSLIFFMHLNWFLLLLNWLSVFIVLNRHRIDLFRHLFFYFFLFLILLIHWTFILLLCLIFLVGIFVGFSNSLFIASFQSLSIDIQIIGSVK